MTNTITPREAKRTLSRLVHAVESGQRFVVWRDGEPVAEIVPVRRGRALTPEQEAARRELAAAMEDGYELGGWTFIRDELYGR